MAAALAVMCGDGQMVRPPPADSCSLSRTGTASSSCAAAKACSAGVQMPAAIRRSSFDLVVMIGKDIQSAQEMVVEDLIGSSSMCVGRCQDLVLARGVADCSG
jgi:hypothetical protein